jgi:hypothetical protein
MMRSGEYNDVFNGSFDPQIDGYFFQCLVLYIIKVGVDRLEPKVLDGDIERRTFINLASKNAFFRNICLGNIWGLPPELGPQNPRKYLFLHFAFRYLLLALTRRRLLSIQA